MTIIKSAALVIASLYWDTTIKKGKRPKRLAKLAPAPISTKTAGNAQQISVEEDANSEKKFAVLSCIFVSICFGYCARMICIAVTV